MKFRVSASQLQQLLARFKHALPKMPADRLLNWEGLMLLDADGSSLTMRVADRTRGWLRASASLDLASCEEPGRALIPARDFQRVVAALSGEIRLSSAATPDVTITTGRARFKLKGCVPALFPEPRQVNPEFVFDLDGDVLVGLLSAVAYASAGLDDPRANLQGVRLWSEDDLLCAAATDAYRAAFASVQLPESLKGRDLDVVMPSHAVHLARQVCVNEPSVVVGVHDDFVAISADDIAFRSTLIGSRFPDVTLFMRQPDVEPLCLPRAEAIKSVDLLRVLSRGEKSDRAVPVVIDPSDPDVVFKVMDSLGQTGAETLGQFAGAGALPRIGFNPSYLVDAMSQLEGDEIRMFFVDAKGPCHFASAAGGLGLNKHVVMPVNLSLARGVA